MLSEMLSEFENVCPDVEQTLSHAFVADSTSSDVFPNMQCHYLSNRWPQRTELLEKLKPDPGL